LAGARADDRWRVFVSRTSELRDYPRGMSYVATVERAISAAGHVIVDMSDFAAADEAPARMCAERVRTCDVYLGVLGARYGSPVRDQPGMSYTELEFDTATEAGLDRLVFMLDMDAEEPGLPASALVDREFGARQDAFRRRVRDSGLTTRSFANAAALGQLVERSLRDLADTRARLASGIGREQVPAEPQPVQASKFVNPPPTVAPAWFQGRRLETRLLASYLADPGIALVTVSGRGGIGKTALVCRLLKGLEAGRVPDGEPAAVTLGGIVYLSRNGMHTVDYPTLVADLLRLLPADEAERLRGVYRDPQRTPAETMLAVLEAFPAGDPVVVLLDNLESAMDAEHETLTDRALHEALAAVLTAPAHAVTLIATTRVPPTELLKVEPARQRQLRLDEGLGSPDAQTVLRELDSDGRLGLRDAPGELLDGLREHTRGFPRALEAVKAILDGDATLTPRDLLDRTRHLPEDQVVRVLVGEAYDLLDAAAQRVVQALAVFPAPVSVVGVDFLLRPASPTTDAAPILTRLVGRQLAQFQDRHYSLHPVDREYARGQLPTGRPGDPPAAFTLTSLQARAADYYAQIRTPRRSWRTLEDLRPQLAEFELRCDTGDYDTAATVLRDIDFKYLQLWGHYRILVELHGRIRDGITNPTVNATHLGNLALSYQHLGEYRQAVDLLAQALAIARNTGDRDGEGVRLTNMGICHYHLGEYRQAIGLYTEALAIFRETGYRDGEGNTLSNLGLCYQDLGEYRQAIGLYTEALAIYRETGYREGQSNTLSNLGRCYQDLGEYRQAIDLYTEALATDRLIGFRYGEAAVLGYLGRSQLAAGDVGHAVTLLDQAVAVADASGSVEPAAEARSWLARARLQLGDPAAALAAAKAGLQVRYRLAEPALRMLEGLALLELGRPGGSVRAFGDAVTAADALLALADRNVAALQARALALSGHAAAAGDPARAAEAAGALARLHAVTDAAGVTADTRRLLGQIARHDRSGLLTAARAAP
jgi:tetratricopeptide (TPR) repeat protein